MDLIELIPIIAVALYYIFRPGKKKEQQSQNREDSAPREQRTLEDILREVMEGPSKPQPKPQPRPKPLVVEEPFYEEETIPEEYESFTGIWEGEKEKPVVASKESLIQVRHDQEEQERAIDFDLRQAVINETILNRPWT